MADSSIAITGGAVDGFTQSGGDFRQAMVLGDATATYTAGVRASGELLTGHTDLFVTGTLTAADVVSASVTGAGSQTLVTGTPTAGSVVNLPLDGESSFAVQVTGTFVATYMIERSLDGGTTWTVIGAFAAGTAYTGSTWTSPGVFHGNASSCTHIRVRCSAFTSGSMAVRILAGAGTGTVTLGSPAKLFRDAGRTLVSLVLSTTAPTTTDTVASLTPVRAGVAGTAATSIAVTAGKSLYITGITASLRTTTAATPWAKLVLRMNPAGAAVVGSPAVVSLGVGGTAAVIGNTANAQFDIPDGLMFSGTQQLALSVSGNVTTNVLDVTLVGYEV